MDLPSSLSTIAPWPHLTIKNFNDEIPKLSDSPIPIASDSHTSLKRVFATRITITFHLVNAIEAAIVISLVTIQAKFQNRLSPSLYCFSLTTKF